MDPNLSSSSVSQALSNQDSCNQKKIESCLDEERDESLPQSEEIEDMDETTSNCEENSSLLQRTPTSGDLQPHESIEDDLEEKISGAKNSNPKAWTTADDDKLKVLVDRCKKDWKKIAKKFQRENKKITPHFLKNRFKFLNNDKFLLRIKFEHQEDLKLAKLFKLHGSKWDLIAQQFPNRTSVMLKNRYYSYIRKNIQALLEELGETWTQPQIDLQAQAKFHEVSDKKEFKKPSDLIETPKSLHIPTIINDKLAEKPLKFSPENKLLDNISSYTQKNPLLLLNEQLALLQGLNQASYLSLKPTVQMPSVNFSNLYVPQYQRDLITMLRMQRLKNQLQAQAYLKMTPGFFVPE